MYTNQLCDILDVKGFFDPLFQAFGANESSKLISVSQSQHTTVLGSSYFPGYPVTKHLAISGCSGMFIVHPPT